MEDKVLGLDYPDTVKAINRQARVNPLTALKSRFQHLLNREKRVGDPNISVDTYLFGHGNEGDMVKIGPHFDQCDIYIPEGGEWDDPQLTVINQVSAGQVPPEVGFNKAFKYNAIFRPLLKMIYRSRKPIAFIDVPAHNPLTNELVKAYEDLDIFLDSRSRYASFEERLNAFKQKAANVARLHSQREEYMVQALPVAVHRILELYPSLRDKPELRVLISIGAAHTTLVHKLLKSGQTARSVLSTSPFIFDHNTELERALEMGKEVTEDLVAKALLTNDILNCFSKSLNKLDWPTEKKYRFLREVVAKFSTEDIRNIFEEDRKQNFRNLPLILRGYLFFHLSPREVVGIFDL